MKARKAVYAASLDPITNGHLNVIERMAPLYDEFIVVVAVDPRKTYTFTPEERVEMTKAATAHLPNVTVDVCVGRYVVNYAKDNGVRVIIRGLRNFKDLEDEQTLATENRKIYPGIETIWIPCLPELMHVSSSMVKGHVGADPGWLEQVARSVPAAVAVKLKEKFLLGRARKHWAKLMKMLGDPNDSEEVLTDLLSRYGESHRAYHNLEHIISMLDEAELAGVGTLALLLAIWFHDAIYNPKAKDNEEESLRLAKVATQQLYVPIGTRELVSTLIMATKHDSIPSEMTAQYMVDLDLMILGKSKKEFDMYEAGIRKEYEWVPESEFRAGRAKILRSFLDRPCIYCTARFQKKYEEAARNNLKRSIKWLSN
jgi:pantetheine-phosphate adenylyltransferase